MPPTSVIIPRIENVGSEASDNETIERPKTLTLGCFTDAARSLLVEDRVNGSDAGGKTCPR
jgi:hypothetical protein